MQNKQLDLFWWRWLTIVTVGIILFGLALIFLPNLTQDLFNWLYFGSVTPPTNSSEWGLNYINFLWGVLGATLIGWACSILFILFGSFRHNNRYAWYAISGGVCAWFVIDSSFSLYAGFSSNVLVNLGFFLLFLIPLAATYKRLHKK